MREHGPVHVEAEVLASRKVGAFRHLTLSAPGVPERFRPGNFVMLSVPGQLTRCALWIHRVRQTSAYGPTFDVVVEASGAATTWIAAQPVGARCAVTGPLGRPFALPREPAQCLLMGEGYSASALFPLAERLRERGSSVSLAIGASDEAHLLSTTDARRWVRSVTVLTADGTVGRRGSIQEHVSELVGSQDVDVVYAAGSASTLATVAAAADSVGAWSQVALETPVPCGTGICHGCVLPVVGEDSIARDVRTCAEGPVVRGDRVRWADL